MWTGAISFGLIYIPVNMYKATEERHPGFHLVSEDEHCPIKYTRVCKYTDEEIPYSKIAKSYEYEKGKTVIIEEQDLQKAYSKRSESIQIVEFVKEEQILPKYFQQPYFLEPQKGAGKVYALLSEALSKSGKVGITKYVLHNLEHLGILASEDETLILNQIRYSTEIRDPSKLSIPHDVKKDKEELGLAINLIDKLTKKFEPEKYKDTFKQDLDRTIKSKLEKGEIEVLEERGLESKKGEVVDIMDRLKASIAKSEREEKDAS